jgi:DNA mismatch repair ATPase MutS
MLFSVKLAFALLLTVIAANVAIQIYYRPRVQHLLRPISALPNLLAAAKQLASIELPEMQNGLRGLHRDANKLRWVRSWATHLQRDSASDPIREMIAGYANLLFLADINAFVFSIEQIKRHRGEIESLVHTVGLLDAMCAAAEFRRSLPVWCTPELSRAGAIAIINGAGIYHPLLENPVPNDFVVDGRPWLITGSNMAGKTTYIRSAGVCIVLGQTLATCPAVRWRSRILDVHTLINRNDDLIGGRSYFLVEAEHVKEMLDASTKESRCIFLIDELFRGTNTPERLSAARGVLAQLSRSPHMCVVSTHDLELIDLLGETWESWHFEERAVGRELNFDYRVKRGAATAGNALKVLEATDYPSEVMDTAYATFELLAAIHAGGAARQRDTQRDTRAPSEDPKSVGRVDPAT